MKKARKRNGILGNDLHDNRHCRCGRKDNQLYRVYQQITEGIMVYQLNLKGFAPAYYADKNEAIQKYWYLKEYFSRVSLREISYGKMIWKVNKCK